MVHSMQQDGDVSGTPLATPQQAFAMAAAPPGQILVVDSDEVLRKTIVARLRHRGYDVWQARNGDAALQHMRSQRFDVVLVDLVMPHTAGLALLRAAQQHGHQTAFIVMTGFASLDTAVAALQAGATDFLPKPCPLDLLHLVVARALATQRLAARAKQVELYERLAHTDGLTDLYNYRFFQHLLSVELSRAQRFQRPLSLMMLDIDYFKVYNDAHGHPAGDRVLQQFAHLLRRSSRSYDLVARYGGDEFIIILPETSKKTAAEVAERIRTAVQGTGLEGDQQRPGSYFTASFGIASFPEDATDQASLVSKADHALYQAKTWGRNRVCLYRPDDA